MNNWILGIAAALAVCTGSFARAEPVDYVRDVKPILARCHACHGALRQKNGLRLDSPRAIRQGGLGGPAIEPGSADQSLLIDAVTGANGALLMPPEGEAEPLQPAQIATLKAWIDQGAAAPEEPPPPDPREHWAFRAPVRPRVPAVRDPGWVRNPIDAFIAHKREQQGLAAAPPADRAASLRRVHVDLVGLPPTGEELRAFLADRADDAYERAVDRLLASPRYAERWGRHWMDIWRYSDWYGSRGVNQLRNSRRHIWRYRDWIIESIAQDKGYDRMLLEMLAPDELEPGNLAVQHAGGFLGRNYYLFNRHVWLQDAVEYTGMALLGLTFRCARCHDHKYDPISQEEYYAFRAFFEPHRVRTDRIPGKDELIKGEAPMNAAPGDRLAEGIDRVYDADPDAATYLLKRGNEKDPVTDRPIPPGTPAVLGAFDQRIEPVPLPPEVVAPELRPELRDELLEARRRRVERAQAALAGARQRVARIEQRLARLEAGDNSGDEPQPPRPVLEDDFTRQRPDLWQVLSGTWRHQEGHLAQTEVGNFLTMMSRVAPPRDFQARLRYKTTEPGEIHSIGISFDVADAARDWQAVYTAINGSRSTVQAFHRQEGRELYPDAGIVPHAFSINQELTLDLAVQGEWLNVWVNGQLVLAYKLPVPRRDGLLALWAHSATAEFYELRVEELRETTEVVQSSTANAPSPFAPPGRRDLEARLQTLQAGLAGAEQELALAALEQESFETRLNAELARCSRAAPDRVERLAAAAARAEARLAEANAQAALAEAERRLRAARAAVVGEAGAKQLQDAERMEAQARQALDQARAAARDPGTRYAPVGEVYPMYSSGRRLALARWIASPRNPLTARVAVNHVWLRHMGAALVPSVFNFGLNGKPPTHPELLDWLAVEFVEQGYSLRALHRLIVTSSTYRMSSTAHEAFDRHAAVDPENRWYWRANPRRMEAEVVRDSLLALGGNMSFERGGPELDPALADVMPRRSLYFRHTPDDKALLLELFDSANASECYQREESIMPQQALALHNGPFAWSQARLIARRVAAALPDGGGQPGDFVAAAYQHVLGRQPSDEELALCEEFLRGQQALLQSAGALTPAAAGPRPNVLPAPQAALRAREGLVQVLINSHEFVTVR